MLRGLLAWRGVAGLLRSGMNFVASRLCPSKAMALFPLVEIRQLSIGGHTRDSLQRGSQLLNSQGIARSEY